MLKKIDNYFFPGESNDLPLKEKMWFYGNFAAMYLIAAIVFMIIK